MSRGGKKSKGESVIEDVITPKDEQEETTESATELVGDEAVAEVERQAAIWDEAFDREEGPFDIDEVDLEADSDEVKRIDFGTLVVTPFEGMTMQLQVVRETNKMQAILVGDGDSALEVQVFAGPTRTSILPDIRADIFELTTEESGRIQVLEGPFGTELRRIVPTTDPQGNAATLVSRTWLVSGPGWVLRGVLFGKATFEPDNAAAQVKLTEFFGNLVVRRGNVPAAPGSLLPMSPPDLSGLPEA